MGIGDNETDGVAVAPTGVFGAGVVGAGQDAVHGAGQAEAVVAGSVDAGQVERGGGAGGDVDLDLAIGGIDGGGDARHGDAAQNQGAITRVDEGGAAAIVDGGRGVVLIVQRVHAAHHIRSSKATHTETVLRINGSHRARSQFTGGIELSPRGRAPVIAKGPRTEIATRTETVAAWARIKTVVIGSRRARIVPEVGGFELGGGVGANFCSQGVPICIGWHLPSGRADAARILYRVPIVEAAELGEVGLVTAVDVLGPFGRARPSRIVQFARDGVSIGIHCGLEVF